MQVVFHQLLLLGLNFPVLAARTKPEVEVQETRQDKKV